MRHTTTYLIFIGALIFISQQLCAHIIPFNFDAQEEHPLRPLFDTQGMEWHNDLNYLTYLMLDENNQLYFRTYPFSTINVAGFYRLAAPVSNEITISASNVTLDLNGHTISGGTNGIVINSGLNNVTIKNGTISSITLDGVQINSGCSDIAIDNLIIEQALVGIAIDTSRNCMIRNCDMNRNTTGIQLDTCANIIVQQCNATANIQAGYDLISTLTSSFINCTALSTGDGNTNASGDQASVFGFITRSGSGNIFEQCAARSTQNLSATDYQSYVAGFGMREGERCSKIIECEANSSMSNAGGNTVPYGIWLEGMFDGLTTVTESAPVQSAGTDWGLAAWSPDGNYLTLSCSSPPASGAVQLYRYDYQESRLYFLQQIENGDSVFEQAWHPTGGFLALAVEDAGTPQFELILYRFDPVTEQLQEIQRLEHSTLTTQSLQSCDWSYDGKYLAVGGENSTGSIATALNIRTYEFDIVAQRLIETDAIFQGDSVGSDVYTVRWSPDGAYLAANSLNADYTVVYPFDRTTKTLDVANSINTGVTAVSYSSAWSPDGRYLAVTISASAHTRIYRFDGTSLTQVAQSNDGSTATSLAKNQWSPDGRFLAVAGITVTATGDTVRVYFFDPDGGTLAEQAAFTNTNPDRTYGAAWSPDGSLLAVSLDATTDGIALKVFTGLNYPEKNIILNNKCYCNSNGTVGFGINGSSIKNSIIGNTAYDNPLNYACVTNVFNQLFGNGPTLLQNIGLESNSPILMPIDLPTKLLRIESLAEYLVVNLL